MTPSTKKKNRLLVFLAFSLLFFLLIPVVVLYATGFRLNKDFEILPTGGVYVYSPDSGVSISINDSVPEKTTIFTKSIFVQNLKPGNYKVKVEKEGFAIWQKTVQVSERRVAEAYPFLISDSIATTTIPFEIRSGVQKLFATSTPVIAKKIIVASSPTSTATTTASTTTEKLIDVKKDISLYKDGNKILAKWNGRNDEIPFYFCLLKISCENNLDVFESKFALGDVAFFPNRDDVILFSNSKGIFVTEFDKRSPQNTLLIIAGDKLDFRLDGNILYIKDKTNYYSILLQ